MMRKRLLGWGLVAATVATFGRPATVRAAVSQASDVRASNDEDSTPTASPPNEDGEFERESGVVAEVTPPVAGKLGTFLRLDAGPGDRLSPSTEPRLSSRGYAGATSSVTATRVAFERPATVHAAASEQDSDVRVSNDEDSTAAASPANEDGVVTGLAFPFGLRLSPVSGKLGMFMHMGVGVFLGKRLSLGFEVHGLLTRFRENIRGPSGERLSLGMAYAGATSSVTLWRPGRFELALEGLVGVGGACISDLDDDCPESSSCLERVIMFVGEPALAIYVHPHPFFRMGLKGGYRFVAHRAWSRPNHFELSGAFVGLELQLGYFGRRRLEPR